MAAARSTAKLDALIEMQEWAQAKWKRDREFEVDAAVVDGVDEKFFATFPYPYMNGFLHLGHAFTLCKCEFAVSYHRLKNRRCLFPMGFHCTGMPIKASADKIRREMAEFGFPPVFPEEDSAQAAAVAVGKSRRSKAVAKSGNLRYQWQIMRQMNGEFSDSEIRAFADPVHWLEYFPAHCRADLELAGLKIDWRRSFITTDRSPWYDRFVRWQMRRLRAQGRVRFGDRYTVFCPLDGQPCMDHDRASGEGVAPLQSRALKLRMDDGAAALVAVVAAGGGGAPTACFVNPGLEYVAAAAEGGGEFLVTPRCARNMAYQGLVRFSESAEGRVPEVLRRVSGAELLGQRTVEWRGRSLPLLPLESLVAGTGAVVTGGADPSPSDLVYCEPESAVVSRSGDECVVALCAQWFLDYGDAAWKHQALDAVARLETFSAEAKNNLANSIAQLHEHACSRSFGLGSRLPWDEQYLIESLTDSTIYTAFYTVAHILQSVDIGSEEETDALFDAVFAGDGGEPDDDPLVSAMRREFRFWYPVDLRCTGKDLLQNHIPYFLYTHCALFPEHHWPRAVNANGLLQLNAAKMSKSTGNFLTLRQSIRAYSADATRLVLADAGDSVEDANFMESQAEAVVLRLFALVQWTAAAQATGCGGGGGERDPSFADRVLASRVGHCVQNAERAILAMQFKDALKHAFFAMIAARDEYLELCGPEQASKTIIRQFIHTLTILLSVFCPHTAEHIYCRILNNNNNNTNKSVLNEQWPAEAWPTDQGILDAAEHLAIILTNIRRRKGNATHLTIGVKSAYPEWQQKVIQILTTQQQQQQQPLDNRQLLELFNKQQPTIASTAGKKLMPFAQMIKQKLERGGQIQTFDEMQLFSDLNVQEYLRRATGLASVDAILDTADNALPYKPTLRFSSKGSAHKSFANPEVASGLVEVRLFQIFDTEYVHDLAKRLARRVRRPTVYIAIQDLIKCRRQEITYNFVEPDTTFSVKDGNVTCGDVLIDDRKHRLVYLTQKDTNK